MFDVHGGRSIGLRELQFYELDLRRAYHRERLKNDLVNYPGAGNSWGYARPCRDGRVCSLADPHGRPDELGRSRSWHCSGRRCFDLFVLCFRDRLDICDQEPQEDIVRHVYYWC